VCFHEWQNLPHELGHNLGLRHWGTDEAGRAHSKPNYPSIMSYAYTGSWPHFSTGVVAPLDPGHLPREDAPYSPGVDLSFLAGVTPPRLLGDNDDRVQIRRNLCPSLRNGVACTVP
jgi:hypothetical protein